MADVFISYSRRDLAFTKRLSAALTERGMEVWVDVQDIPPAARWDDELKDAIKAAHAFVFVISAESVASKECAKELEYAAGLNKRIVPVHLSDGAVGPLPEPLASHNWVPQVGLFTDDFDTSLAALERGITTDLDWVHQHTRWGQKAAEWEEHGRDRSFLISGTELDAAEQWLVGQAGKQPAPTTLQSTFVLTSRRDATRRLRRGRALVSIALVIAVALSAFALVQRGIAVANQELALANLKTAQSGQLAAEARAVLPADPELSTMLALRAQQIGNTSQGDQILRVALPAFQTLRTLAVGAPLTSVVVSPDGRKVLLAVENGPAQIWDAGTGRRIATLADNYVPSATPNASPDYHYAIAFSPDSSRVVTAYGPGAAGGTVWDADSGHVIATLALAGTGAMQNVLDLSFSPDGTKLVGSSLTPMAIIWDAKTGQPVVTITDAQPVQSVRFSPDGNTVLTADNVAASIWNARTGALVSSIGAVGPFYIHASFSPDGTQIVTVADTNATVWDVATATQVATLSEPGGALLTSAAFSPDGKRIVTASGDDTARVWNLRTDTKMLTQAVLLNGHTLDAIDAVFAPSGNQVVTASSDGTARIWDAWPREYLSQFTAPDGTFPMKVSGDGRMVTSLSSPGTTVWNVATGEKLLDLTDHTGATGGQQSASFSADSRRLISEADDGTIIVSDIATRSQVARFGDGAPANIDPLLSADGTRALAVTLNGVEVWDVAKGARVGGLIAGVSAGDMLIGAALSPDGTKAVLSSASGAAVVYDTATGRATVTLLHAGPYLNSVAFSPDGRRIITAGQDGSARVWDVSTGKQVMVLRQQGQMLSAEFSADGSDIVTVAGGIGTVVWQASTGQQLLVLPDPNVTSALMTQDGKRVATISFGASGAASSSSAMSGPAVFWSAELAAAPSGVIQVAEGRVSRGFTAAERQQYFPAGLQ